MVETVREPQSRGYTLAMTISFGALVAYISSIQQIVFDAFHEGRLSASCSLRSPRRWRSPPGSIPASSDDSVCGGSGIAAALAFVIVTAAHARGRPLRLETLWTFVALQGLTMGCFAFTSSNLGTLAMEHMAEIAGTASSVQGVIGTVGAAAIGFLIGQRSTARPIPFVVGTALCAAGGS